MRHENGNVLFLILIAVALFAALSYAVTSSSRSSGNDAGKEATALLATQIVQYPVFVRNAIIRMRFKGINAEDIEFLGPADFDDLTNTAAAVFHPDGGKEVYQTPPVDAMEPGWTPVWDFRNDLEIENVGTNVSAIFDGNDIVMEISGLRKEICDEINDRLGIGLTPQTAGIDEISSNSQVGMATPPPSTEILVGPTGGFAGLEPLVGQAAGCFYDSSWPSYTFYSVLIER